MEKEINNWECEAYSVNGIPYKKDDDGRWVVDQDAAQRQAESRRKDQEYRDALIYACRSRICTEDEMKEVERLGHRLFLTYSGGISNSYQEAELDKRLNELLLQQFRLRRIAEADPKTLG